MKDYQHILSSTLIAILSMNLTLPVAAIAAEGGDTPSNPFQAPTSPTAPRIPVQQQPLPPPPAPGQPQAVPAQPMPPVPGAPQGVSAPTGPLQGQNFLLPPQNTDAYKEWFNDLRIHVEPVYSHNADNACSQYIDWIRNTDRSFFWQNAGLSLGRIDSWSSQSHGGYIARSAGIGGGIGILGGPIFGFLGVVIGGALGALVGVGTADAIDYNAEKMKHQERNNRLDCISSYQANKDIPYPGSDGNPGVTTNTAPAQRPMPETAPALPNSPPPPGNGAPAFNPNAGAG